MPTTVKSNSTQHIWFENDNSQRQAFDASGDIVKGDFVRSLVWFAGETPEQRQQLIATLDQLGPKADTHLIHDAIISHGAEILGISKQQLEASRCLLSQTIAAEVGEELVNKVTEKMAGKFLAFGNKRVTLSVNSTGQLIATARFDQLALNDPNNFEPVAGSEEGELAMQSTPIPGAITFQYAAPKPGASSIACPDIELSHPEHILPLLPEVQKTKAKFAFKKELMGGLLGTASFATGLILLLVPGVNVVSWICFALMALGLVIDGICAKLVQKKASGVFRPVRATEGASDIPLDTAEPTSQSGNNLSSILTYDNKLPPTHLPTSASSSGFFAGNNNDYQLPPSPAPTTFFSTPEPVKSQATDNPNPHIIVEDYSLAADPSKT